jgi:hypothetical protein
MKILSLFFLLFCIVLLPCDAHAQNWDQWPYHIDITVQTQADDSFDAVYADFTHLLKSTFHQPGTLDENSIRVAPLQNGRAGAPVSYRFIKDAQYDAAANAAGTLIFSVAGSADKEAAYRVYFDIAANGHKPAFSNSVDVPDTANMIWNSSFEILSQNYTGQNRYANAGQNMPRGWWGNLRSIPNNLATSAHSGEHALGFVAVEGKNESISTAPSPPALRVVPGQNYTFSFWIKGEKLTSKYPVHASVYWYDENQKYFSKTAIPNLPDGGSFDWTKIQSIFTAPDNAYFGTMYIGTYSATGILTVDDVNIHISVPPLLQKSPFLKATVHPQIMRHKAPTGQKVTARGETPGRISQISPDPERVKCSTSGSFRAVRVLWRHCSRGFTPGCNLFALSGQTDLWVHSSLFKGDFIWRKNDNAIKNNTRHSGRLICANSGNSRRAVEPTRGEV